MKAKVFLRVARQRGSRSPIKVRAGVTPSQEPLLSPTGKPLPTAAFAVVFDLPDEMFKRAEQVLAEIEVAAAAIEIPTQVVESEAS